jgi:CBS-domain-containing membrane protein
VADAAAHDLAVVPGDQSSWLDAQRAEAKALVREIRSQAVTRRQLEIALPWAGRAFGVPVPDLLL